MLRPPRCCLKVSVVQTRVCTMPFCVISGCLCDSHRPSQRGQGRCPPVSHCSVPRRLRLRPRCAGGCRNRHPGPPPPPFFFNIILALVHSERAFRRGLMQVTFLPLSSPPWSPSTQPRPRSGSSRGSAWATRQSPPVTLLVSFQLLGLSGVQEPGNSTPDVPASGPARPAP